MAERLVYDIAIGLGALAYLVFALGLLQLLRLPFLIGLLIVILLVVYLPIKAIAKEVIPRIKEHINSRLTLLSAAVGGILVVITGLALIGALAPPTSSDWDGLAYHLAIPKLYLRHGGIYYIPFSSHSNFPFTVEMLYTLGLGLRSTALAKMFHLVFGVVATCAVFVAAKRHFGSQSALFAVLLFAGIPMVGWEATVSYIDLALALYTILPVAAILAFSSNGDRKWLYLSAITAGLAAGTKMTALAAIVVFAAWAGIGIIAGQKRVGEHSSEDSCCASPAFGGAFKQSIVYALIAFVVASPWYIKSFIHTGNPVYPFFFDTFGGRNWSAEIAEIYRNLQWQFGIGHGIVDFLRIPWDLVFHSQRFYDRPGLHIGPAYLALLPLAILAASKNRKVLYLWLLSLVLIIIWFSMSQQSRYLLPVFSIISVGAAGTLVSLPKLKYARWALWLSGFSTAVFSVLVLVGMASDCSSVALGFENKESYLSRRLDTYRAIRFINKNTPTESKVILYGDTRGFYLDRDYLWGDPGHNTIIPYSQIKEAEGFSEALNQRGITHALVNYRYFGNDGQYVRLVTAAIHSGLFEEIYRDEHYPVAVFALRNSK